MKFIVLVCLIFLRNCALLLSIWKKPCLKLFSAEDKLEFGLNKFKRNLLKLILLDFSLKILKIRICLLRIGNFYSNYSMKLLGFLIHNNSNPQKQSETMSVVLKKSEKLWTFSKIEKSVLLLVKDPNSNNSLLNPSVVKILSTKVCTLENKTFQIFLDIMKMANGFKVFLQKLFAQESKITFC